MKTGSEEPSSFGHLCHMHRAALVRAVRGIRTQVPDRVIRNRREMNSRVEPLDLRRGHVSNITSPLFVAVWLGAEVAFR
jgi:hypothetical protein